MKRVAGGQRRNTESSSQPAAIMQEKEPEVFQTAKPRLSLYTKYRRRGD